jgi:hypothetical protein
MVKLESALNDEKWYSMIDNNAGLDADSLYNLFVESCQSLIERCIPKRTVSLGRKDPHFVSPLVKTLLCKRNKLMYQGKLQAVETLNVKINKLISENRKTLMTKANNGDIKALWNAVKINTKGR